MGKIDKGGASFWPRIVVKSDFPAGDVSWAVANRWRQSGKLKKNGFFGSFKSEASMYKLFHYMSFLY